jgi:DNA-binding transcriptional ArsR family regulator
MWALQRGDFCVKDLMAAVGASQVVTSQQLIRLRRAGLVTSQRDGNRRIYSSTVKSVGELLNYLVSSSQVAGGSHPGQLDDHVD